MSAVLSMTVRLESTTCATCGVEFAMPEHLIKQRRNNKGSVYCPSGHVSSWHESEAERLKKKLEATERDLAFQKSQREAAEAQGQRYAGRALKAEGSLKRAKNGVCPCCKRSFTALRRHMKTKHPEWKP